jgi:acyl-CoA thioester hydrolase
MVPDPRYTTRRLFPHRSLRILTFTHILTVPPSAIDANGHVNNVAFIQWMQDAAIAHSTAVGALPLTALHHALWVVRSHHIDYKRQAFLGDLLHVHTWIVDCRMVSSRRGYEFVRPVDKVILATAQTDWVFIDATTHRPKAIPDVLQALYNPPPSDADGKPGGSFSQK